MVLFFVAAVNGTASLKVLMHLGQVLVAVFIGKKLMMDFLAQYY